MADEEFCKRFCGVCSNYAYAAWSSHYGTYACWNCMFNLMDDYEGVKRIAKNLEEGLEK